MRINKVMNKDYCEYINYNKPELISEIREFIKYSNKHDKFFVSKLGQCRIDFPFFINKQFREFMPFTISDYGCFKNVPGWVYPIHKDANRKFAMNMLLSEVDDGFETLLYNDDKSESWPIPYITDQWVMLNTKKFHSVKNNSKIDRYTISIGCTTIDYNTMHNMFASTNNIGLKI